MLVGWTDRQTHIVIKEQTQGSCNTTYTLIYISHFHDEDKDLGPGQYLRPLVVVTGIRVIVLPTGGNY